jgi:hypothetical protein
MKNCAMLTVLAGVLAGGAFANDPDATTMQAIEKPAPQAGYSDRLNQVVYGTTLAAGDWRARGGASRGGNRFSFTPGPGANLTPVIANGWAWAVDQAATSTAAPSSTQQVISFKYFLDPVGGPAVSATALPAVPDLTLNVDLVAFTTPGFITFFAAPVGLVDGDGLPVTITFDRPGATDGIKGFFTVEVFEADGVTRCLDVGPSIRGLSAPATGSSDGTRWADANNDGVFLAAEGFGSLANYRTYYHQIQGDVPPPPPPSFTDLGCLADGTTTQSFTLAANQTRFFKICLNGDATDSAGQFLSIDSEGSAFGASAALYSAATANLVGNISSDEDGGSGTNFQLSYGIGRHAAVGDGKQYDGINGEVFAGEYYVAVTGDGGSFGGSFNASGVHAGGDVTINFNTNTNGGALPAFVEPTLRAGNDLGILSEPGAPGSAFILPRFDNDWYKFELATDIAAPLFLDIDFSATDSAISDAQSRIFDASGNALFESNDAGAGYNRPQFSFGDAGPRTQGASPVPFDGSTAAVLPAGVYYMATSLIAQSNSALGRFHVRSNSGSSLSYQADFYLGTGSGTGCGCAADYNVDGGVDGGDVEAFFIDWSNAAGCSDVNIDGGVDGGDVEAFFTVWSAGGC